MAYTPNPRLYDDIVSICLNAFADAPRPLAILERAWSIDDFPMHCPEHHFLVPAALLTAGRKARGDDASMLVADLAEALSRAKNVLPGFCGLYGACGAAVGAGIFASLLTDANPYSTTGWGDANAITGECLQAIAALGGPRCCKRTCLTAVAVSMRYAREHLGIDIGEPGEILCGHNDKNKECLGKRCPYYAEKDLSLPRFVTAECCQRPIDMTYKQATLAWKVQPGDRVAAGDALCGCEVEKTTFDLPAPFACQVLKLHVEDGEPCDIYRPICRLRKVGEA
ncbi:MAG: hypothetical protein GX558_12780 [Clostridiales bacterium]|nr:hypothetical protein [Clostridiales bacterium]